MLSLVLRQLRGHATLVLFGLYSAYSSSRAASEIRDYRCRPLLRLRFSQAHTPVPGEVFPGTADLAVELAAAIRGEVRFDAASRALYATDASNYRHIPIGLVIPRDEDDVIAAVAICRRHDAPILTRGAGTSLAGQACNAAVVFDFSKYMNGIGEVDLGTNTMRVQPGAILDRVRDKAELHNLTFAPDPATHSRCTLGGMIGNNSCGVHALMGGKTVDNIVALDLLLYDGTRMEVGATSEAELASTSKSGAAERDLPRAKAHSR